MADDDISSIGLDTSPLEEGINNAAGLFDKLTNSSVKSAEKITQSFNKAGETLSTFLKTTLAAGVTASATFSESINEADEAVTNLNVKLSVSPSKFTAASESARKYAIQLVQLTEATKNASTSPKVADYGLKGGLSKDIIKDTKDFDKAIQATTLSGDKLRAIFAGKFVGPLTTEAISAKTAFDKLTSSAKAGLIDTDKYLKDVIAHLTSVQNIGIRGASTYKDNFARSLIAPADLVKGSAKEIFNLQTAGSRLTEEIAKRPEVTHPQLENLAKQIGVSDFANIPPQLQGIADGILNVAKAEKELGSAAAGASVKQQNLIRENREGSSRFAGITKTIFESKTPPTALYNIPDDKRLKIENAFQNQLGKTSTEAQRLNASITEIGRAADIAFASGKTDPLNKSLDTLIGHFNKLIAITNTYGIETAKAYDKNATAAVNARIEAGKLTDEARRHQTTQAALPSAQTHVIESTKTAFGPLSVNATAAATSRYNQIVDKLSNDIASGTLKLNEYAQALDLVKSKAVIPAGTSAVVREATKDLSQLATTITSATGASVKQRDLIRESRQGLDLASKTVRGVFEKQVGGPPTISPDIDPSKVESLTKSYRASFVSAGDEARKLNASLKDVQRTVTEVASGKDITTGFGTLANKIKEIIALYEQFGVEGQKAYDKNATAAVNARIEAGKLTDEVLKANATKAALPGAQTHVIESTKTAFGPLSDNATVAATQRYNSIVNKLSQDIASGTLKLNEYAQALDLVKNKAVIPAGTSAVVREATKDLSQLATTITSATGATGLFHAAFNRANDVLRIFGRLEIYRAFSNLNNIIYESIRSAGEFGSKIALIQTITQDQVVGTNAWAESLKKLSSEFAVPVIEVASAAYETLSNQVTKSKADTEEFLQTVLEFGRTTGSKAPESVGIFTTAIKGFGRDVSESKDIAALFFNTIDYGRITAEGLNAVLGRTAPLARDLGVSLEEVSAGIVQLTLHGFNPQEAGTRVANFLLAFEKPSKEFKKYLAGFGVETGKDFITVSGGLAEAINRIAQAANSGNVAVKDLFPEIRKLQAALGLSTDGGKEYADTLDNITKKNDNYANAVKITAESPAQKAKQQLNELAIAGTALGTKLLGVFTGISDAIGGAATRFLQISRIAIEIGLIFGSLKIATLGLFILDSVPIIAARLAIINLTAAIKAGTLASFLFTGSIAGLKAALIALASISPLKAFLAGFTATYLLLNRIDESYDAFIEKIKKKVDLGLDESFTSFKNNLNRTTEDVDRNSKEWHRLFSQRSADTTKDLEKQFATHEKLLDKIKDKSDIVFHSLTDVLHNNIQTIDAASKKASEYSKEAGVRIDQNNADYSKGVFDRQIATSRAVVAKVGFSGASQYETDLTVKRINDLRVQAKGFSKEFEINPLAGEKLLKTLDEAGKLLEGLHPDFLKKAIDRGSYQDIQNLLRLEQDILKAKQAYNAELERQRSIQAGIAADLKNKKAAEEEIVKDIENRLKKLRDFSNVDKEGNFVKAETDSRGNITKTVPQVAAEKLAERDTQIAELKDIFKKIIPQDFEGFLKKAGIEQATQNKIDATIKQIEGPLKGAQDKQSGLAGQLDSVKSESIKLTTAFTDLTKAVNDQKAALFDREKERNEFIGQSERLAALIPKITTPLGGTEDKDISRIEYLQNLLKHLEINPQNTAITLKTLDDLRNRFTQTGQLQQKVDLGPNKEGVVTATTVEGLLDVIKANLQGIAGSTPIINEQVVKIKGINEQLGYLGEGFNKSRSSIEAFVDALNKATARISGINKGLPNIPSPKQPLFEGTLPTSNNIQSTLSSVLTNWIKQGQAGTESSYGSASKASEEISKILDTHEEAANNLRKNLHSISLRSDLIDAAKKQGYPVGEITPSSISALSKSYQGKPPQIDLGATQTYYDKANDILGLNKQPSGLNLDILGDLRHELEHSKQQTPNVNTAEIGAGLGDIVNTAQVFKDHLGKALDYQVKLAPGVTQSVDSLAKQFEGYGKGSATEGLATPAGQEYLKKLLGGDGASTKGNIQKLFEPSDKIKDYFEKDFNLTKPFEPIKDSTKDAAKSTDNLAKSASSASNKLDDLQKNFSTPPYQEPQEPKPPEDINKLIGIKNAISDASLNPVIRQFEEAGQRASSGITNDDYLRLALGNQQQYGGYINYYNKGFSPKGTDTIPAMLSPGEYVMPADKTSIYKGVLDSMRAGYYAGGGGVVASFEAYTPKAIGNYQNNSKSVNHSVNVGDINIHMAGDAKSVNGRTIAEQIRREIRTGGITKDFFGSQS